MYGSVVQRAVRLIVFDVFRPHKSDHKRIAIKSIVHPGLKNDPLERLRFPI